jgi:hypothetical protein
MRAELPNADGVLKPGQFVRVSLDGAVRNNALAVPQVAVLDGPQGKFVYVADKDKDGKDIAATRPVVVGPWVVHDGVNLWVIDSGIKAGDKVITDGVSKLRPGAPIKFAAAPQPAAAGAPAPASPAPAAPAAPKSLPTRRRPLMLARFFIDRPIFAAVISIFLIIAGLAAIRTLPVAPYPEIAPPVVTVQAIYPGASAEVVERTVAAPIENAINGIPGMMYMSSNSASNGVVQIQVTFEIGTDIDIAAVNVNNRVKQVEPRLPEEVRRQGVTVERGSSSFLQVVAFYSPDGRYDDLFTSNYVTLKSWMIMAARHDQPRSSAPRITRCASGQAGPAQLARPAMSLPRSTTRMRSSRPARSARRRSARARTLHGHDQGRRTEDEQIIVRESRRPTLRLDVARRTEFQGLRVQRPLQRSPSHARPGSVARRNALEVAKRIEQDARHLERAHRSLSYGRRHDASRGRSARYEDVGKGHDSRVPRRYLFLQSWRAAIIPLPRWCADRHSGHLDARYSIIRDAVRDGAVDGTVDDAIVVLETSSGSARRGGRRCRGEGHGTGHRPDYRRVCWCRSSSIAFLGGLTASCTPVRRDNRSRVISGIVALSLRRCALILSRCAPPLLFAVRARQQDRDLPVAWRGRSGEPQSLTLFALIVAAVLV